MMEQKRLVEHILEKCRQQKWYGGDESNTALYTKRNERYEIYYTEGGEEKRIDHDPDDHPRKASFAYVPATEEQLLATEQALGFPLPPFLHMLYTQVANGGFGPGYGLHGALTGFEEAGNIVDGYNFHLKHAQIIEIEDYAVSLVVGDSFDLFENSWPRYFLYLCDWGYATTSCLDAATGHVYLHRPSTKASHNMTFLLEAPSLEAWFELWLSGDLKDKGQYIKDPAKPDTELAEVSVVPLYTSEDTFEELE
ncbi:SMI1/KNR4 family protein [Dictyobacter aurantiacus]|uniref:Knr4/Smi1-like domain-containing protein n=1 Tax=Dictyobacter aurantiacus TaxID=1936993 RepID=A0A401ZJZ3_9CHLR|nr:SMI1/KNR4 family protein [Dictyobacter aurantiacus]GCE07185.1 hypothetical protein KDAU_45140 [Dictyobacter aurantiacus]